MTFGTPHRCTNRCACARQISPHAVTAASLLQRLRVPCAVRSLDFIFCVFDAMSDFFLLCTHERLWCYICVYSKHKQMSATPAFFLQAPTPVQTRGVMPHPVYVVDTQQAPYFNTGKDDLCYSCQAAEQRGESYRQMPLQYMPPASQGVDCIPPCEPAPQSRCMPPVSQGVHCVSPYDPDAQSRCMPHVSQGVHCVLACEPAPQSRCMPPVSQGVHCVSPYDPDAQSLCMPHVSQGVHCVSPCDPEAQSLCMPHVSQGVHCVSPCDPEAQSQCMPHVSQGVHCVSPCDPEAQSRCMPPVASDCNTQYILPAAAPGSMPAFFGMQNTPHIAPSAAGLGTLTKATHAIRGMFMPPQTPRHHTVLVKINNTRMSAPTRTSTFWSMGPQRAKRRSR